MIVRLKHIKIVRSGGKIYRYDRVTGKRINAPHGTQAFIDEVNRLRSGATRVEETKAALAGMLGGLIVAYRASPEWNGLADRTRSDYEKVFGWLDAQNMGRSVLDEFEARHVMKLRDRAFRHHKRRFANYVVQVLSLIFAWGQPRGWIKFNPAHRLEKIRRPRGAPKKNRRWTPAEYAAVVSAATPAMRIALAIGYHTGLREGDVIRLTWDAYKSGMITLTLRKGDAEHAIPAAQALAVALDEARALNAKRKVPCTTIVTGDRGRSYRGEDGFRANFFKLIRDLVSKGKVGAGLTFHGLRTTLASELADEGSDNRDIMAVTGHRSEAAVRPYTEDADRRRRAASAVRKIEQARTKQP